MSRWVLAVALRLLPAWARDRYAAEVGAELMDLPRRRRLGHVARFVVVAWPLRIAVLRAAAARRGHPEPPRHCLLGLWHRWVVLRTDDGQRYRACARCGLDDPRVGRRAPDGVAAVAMTRSQ